MPKVSVIIPCYNQGEFIDEAVGSVLAQTFDDFEIIIVNDGSTDAATNALLEKYSRPKTTVIHTENQGVCTARNTAVKAAAGKYILPLDADDKIEPTYLEKAVNVLDNHPETGVVWCKADFFGAQKGEWDLKPFSLKQIMNNGCVFVTAMFRKSDWERVGGYNVNMVHSLEDWDFWLSFVERGLSFYQIPEILFHYHQHTVSRTTRAKGKDAESCKSIILHHLNLYAAHPDLVRRSMAELLFSKSVSTQVKKAETFNRFRWIKGLYKYRCRRFLTNLGVYTPPPYIRNLRKHNDGSKRKIQCVYFTSVENFGDLLNVNLFALFGKNIQPADIRYGSVVAIGSLLQLCLKKSPLSARKKINFWLKRPLIVCGSGFIEDVSSDFHLLRKLDVRAVRGYKTLEKLRKFKNVRFAKNMAVGDPGLLVKYMVDTSGIDKVYDLGIIPHYVDKENELLNKISVKNSVVIDIQQEPETFIKQIAQCKNIISSAMHGLIAADSLGIPNVRMILSDKITGGDYKYNDYYSAFGLNAHNVIDLNCRSFTDKDVPDIALNYKIKPEQVDCICRNLMEAFPYKDKK